MHSRVRNSSDEGYVINLSEHETNLVIDALKYQRTTFKRMTPDQPVVERIIEKFSREFIYDK